MTPAASTEPPPRLYALVPCAGSGVRAGTAGPKQYAALAGRSLIAHTLAALSQVQRLTHTLVVLSADDCEFERHAQHDADWIARERDWVLVHDAARCLVRPEWIDALIDACLDDDVGGLLALPLADTLKDERDGRSVSTIDRRAKWQAQTPQMFRLKTLRDALAQAADVTDEAGAIEAYGLAPKLVPCGMENFKVTWPQDFELAERLLRTRTCERRAALGHEGAAHGPGPARVPSGDRPMYSSDEGSSS